ncbi:ervatamin-B-like [Lolium perenne]|uniref:ervatamin-B-like n=1 Tax=Lolium perenne TaxID=4522 RepID=UPI0021F5247E|nr:ervatamin-B-like [Lolium perenne]
MARGMLPVITMVVALTAMALAAITPMASTPVEDIIYVSSENVASEESMRGLYERWYMLYRRDGDPIDKEKRFAIFKAEAHAVHKLNEGGARVKHNLNWFADMTQDEYAESFANCSPLEVRSRNERKLNLHQPSEYYPDKLPLTVDWRTVDGVLTSVKHQGNCGSCWAIAAAQAMESVHFLKNKKRVNVSSQEMVDCTNGNNGCKGGRASRAFQYVINKHGIHSSEQYPYVGNGSHCTTPAGPPVMSIGRFIFVHRHNEKKLMDAVALAPIVVSIRGTNSSEFMRYSGGIFRGPCDTEKRHQALLVGYGTMPSDDANDPGVKYWVVKNSWGVSWGERGYMRIERGHEADGGLCGIMRYPLYPAHPK